MSVFIAVVVLGSLKAMPTHAASGKYELNNQSGILQIGEKKSLIVKRNSTQVKTSKIKFSTDNKTVAVVSNTGEITAKRFGKATITAKIKNTDKVLKYKVAVIDYKKTFLAITHDKTSIRTVKYLAKLKLPSKAKITYESSDNSIATVKEGKIVTHNSGKATIKATIAYKGVQKVVDLVAVTVQ